jgi:hypothetical protein
MLIVMITLPLTMMIYGNLVCENEEMLLGPKLNLAIVISKHFLIL